MDERKSDEPRTITSFEHENALMHYGNVNKRSMIQIIIICVTFVLVSLIYVVGNITTTKTLTDTFTAMVSQLNPAIVSEVEADGVHQQPHP